MPKNDEPTTDKRDRTVLRAAAAHKAKVARDERIRQIVREEKDARRP